MTRTRRTITSLAALGLLLQAMPAQAAGSRFPEWVRPAVTYVDDQGWLLKADIQPNEPMTRATFAALMQGAFEGGYSKTDGLVTAGEVSAALVRALGKAPVAEGLQQVSSPDGWRPHVGRRFGTEIVSREMGLRYNRLEDEDALETSASEPMKQADAIYAVWKAKTSPATYSADALTSFSLPIYSETRRQVVEFALSLVGAPYIWGGEWSTPTPSGYPFGAQSHGGFDCSGFTWYVLKEASTTYSPTGRTYPGWSFPERSSSDMARAAVKKLAFDNLLPGDVVFFAPNGTEAKAADVYHVGIYLGKGWMVHSSGSRAGISLAEIGPGSWWNDQLAWGRRIITK